MTGPDPLACSAFVVGAFVLAGALQTAWLASPRSARFALPLDGGLTLGGRRLLGESKTLRGFVVMVPAAGAAFFALAWLLELFPAGRPAGLWTLSPGEYGLVGLAAGFGFMAGELPNSFVKRRFGIPPGGAPAAAPARLFCFVVDRLDSIVGMLAALALVVPVPRQTWVQVLAVGPAIHWSFSLALFLLGAKRRPA